MSSSRPSSSLSSSSLSLSLGGLGLDFFPPGLPSGLPPGLPPGFLPGFFFSTPCFVSCTGLLGMGTFFELACFKDDALDAACLFMKETGAAPEELAALLLLGRILLLDTTGAGAALDGAFIFFFGCGAFVTWLGCDGLLLLGGGMGGVILEGTFVLTKGGIFILSVALLAGAWDGTVLCTACALEAGMSGLPNGFPIVMLSF